MQRQNHCSYPPYSQARWRRCFALAVEGVLCTLLFQNFAAAPLSAQEATPTAADEAAAQVDERDPEAWPRVLEEGSFLIKTYPPQFDEWDGSEIKAHAAIEISEQDKEGSTYGVVDFIARTRVDKDARLVVFDEYLGIGAKVPAQPELESKILGILQRRFNDSVRVVALDRVETALAANQAGAGIANDVAVNNDPPTIVFAERPTLLVYVDGQPAWRQVEGTNYERLLNTRPLLMRDSSAALYLHLFDGWLEARTLEGPWQVAGAAPSGLEEAAAKAQQEQPADLLDGGVADQQEVDESGQPIEKPSLAKGPVPDIVVASEPTELLVTDGAPTWTAIPETGLEFADNTSGNLLRLASGSSYFVLLSGRWFEGPSLDGPWSFVPQDELADDFRQIPDDSPKENVKASIAGSLVHPMT